MAKTKTINLLPQEEFEASTLGRVLKWATGSFRIIVIVTEMVVMIAFLSRFWLDAQNSDLNDAIKIRTAEITSQKDLEDNFRRIQTKLAIVKSIKTAPRASTRLDNVSLTVPQEVVLSTIAIGKSATDMTGTSASELGIAQFLSNLKAQTSFKSAELIGVNSSQDNPTETAFSIKVNY